MIDAELGRCERRGKTVAWHTLESLAVMLCRHRADDTVNRAIARLTGADLIVIDDIACVPVAPDPAEALSWVVDAADEQRSTADTRIFSRAPPPLKLPRFAGIFGRFGGRGSVQIFPELAAISRTLRPTGALVGLFVAAADSRDPNERNRWWLSRTGTPPACRCAPCRAGVRQAR